jgi:acetyl esterase/lipase
MTERSVRIFITSVWFVVLVFAIFVDCAEGSAADDAAGHVTHNLNLRVYKNLSYSMPQRPRCTGDLYVPASTVAVPVPAVLLIHGGGWTRGDKSDADMQLLIGKLVADGYAVFNINYRLVQDGGRFPYSIGDVRNALVYLHSNAFSYGIDSENIALMGSSAGGYLALMTGYGADSRLLVRKSNENAAFRPKCVVCFSPVSELAKDERAFVIDYLDDTAAHAPELYKAAEPLTYAAGGVPTLVVHGVRDSIVPIENSEQLVRGLRRQKCEAKLLSVENASHSIQAGEQLESAYEAVHNFLLAHLI